MCGGDVQQPLQQTDQALQSQQQQHSSYANGRVAGRNSTRAPSSALESCLRNQGVEEAWQLLEVLLQADAVSLAANRLAASDKYTLSQMLSKSDARNMPRAIMLTNTFIESWASDVDEGLFNALLDACCQVNDVPQLEATMDQMRRLRVEPSAVTLGILVKAYGRSRQLAKVMAVWNEMVPQRKQANAVTYGCMLDSCVKCGDLKSALQVFEDVKREGKHRNTVLYTTLIKGCSKQKDLQSAMALFREMKQEFVPYNTITYNSIIDVCVNCGAVHLAEGIFQQMIHEESQTRGSSPDLITFSTLLKGYCQAGELDKAFMVLEAIRERGLPCDELVFNTLIDGCVKIGDLTAGLGLFEEMLGDGARPSTITHSILLKLYRCAGYGHHSAEAVAVLYQHHGLQPPIVGVHRRRETRRRENYSGSRETQGMSPKHMLMHSNRSNLSATASSQPSTPESTPAMPQPGPVPCSWDQGCSPEAQWCVGSAGDYATAPTFSEVQSYIQNVPMQQGGSWMIMGPYPAPVQTVSAGCAPAPSELWCSNPKPKAIIKI